MSSYNYPDSRSSPAFLFSNIRNLISIKLDNQHYLLWKSQFLLILCAHGMIGFVDGSHPCPLEFLLDYASNSTTDVNPQFLTWIQQDQNILCWINATLFATILVCVISLKSTRDVWIALEKRFASMSRSHILMSPYRYLVSFACFRARKLEFYGLSMCFLKDFNIIFSFSMSQMELGIEYAHNW